MAVWLGKTEPFKFSWDDLVRQGSTFWDGVRSAQARNNLQAMAVGATRALKKGMTAGWA